MVKLENNAALPQARALLVIQSQGQLPAISLSTEEIREEVNGSWQTSAANVRQVVSCFIDGKPVKLSAKIAAAYAVECSACFKVVVEIETKIVLSTAYEKGDKSRETCQVNVVRVIEVWATKEKQLWTAAGEHGANGNGSRAAAVSVDLTGGPVTKAQLAGARA